MKESQKETVSAIWSILWRATILGPVFLIFSSAVIASKFAVFPLPILILVYTYSREWDQVFIHSAAWIVALGLFRVKVYPEQWISV